MSNQKQAEYDTRYRAKATAGGMRRVTVMVPESEVQYIRQLPAQMRGTDGPTGDRSG